MYVSDTLVHLVTVEAQSYGPNSLVGIKVVEHVPAVPVGHMQQHGAAAMTPQKQLLAQHYGHGAVSTPSPGYAHSQCLSQLLVHMGWGLLHSIWSALLMYHLSHWVFTPPHHPFKVFLHTVSFFSLTPPPHHPFKVFLHTVSFFSLTPPPHHPFKVFLHTLILLANTPAPPPL